MAASKTPGVNPKLLIWARKRAGRTIEEVAKALKKPPKVIESWEDGTATPTYAQLERLAYVVYKRPLAIFFFPEAPSEPDPEKSFRTLPHAELEELSADTRHKIREAQAFQISLAELTGGENPANRQILREVSISLTEEIRITTAKVRRFVGFEVSDQKAKWKNVDEALKGWRKMIEDGGVFVFKDSFKQRDVSGFSLYHPQFALIIVNNSTSRTRQIFTLFHELGHLLVHVSGITKKDDSFITDLQGDARIIEIFCNRFAAEFLVPEESLEREIKGVHLNDNSVSAIARMFKVSREVIFRRLLDMGLISMKTYQQKAAQLKDEYDADSGSDEGGNYYLTQATYLSERYANLAFANYYRGAISLEQLADYLNVSARSVPGLEELLLQKAAT